MSKPTHEPPRATGQPMGRPLNETTDELKRRLFFDRLTAGYKALRADPDAWSEVEAERAAESPSGPRSASHEDLTRPSS